MSWLIDKEIAERVDRLELDFNRYGVDSYGVRAKDLARFYTILAWLYRNYFQVSVSGIEHIPPRGRAMLVSNHSGGLPVDAAMITTSVFLNMEPPRLVQSMVDKFISRIPFGALWSYRCGQFTGLPEHALQLLEQDRLLMVFPEGHRGTAKLYGDRNSLISFGTGFMRLALRTNTPIIPVAFVGGGDAIPTIANLEGLGHLLGMPYVPITPYLLPVPRPTQLEIYYSAPMTFEGSGNEEDRVVLGYVDQVRERIAQLLDTGVRVRLGRGEAAF